jgi:hypothetical protein
MEIDLPPTATDVSADGLLGLPANDRAAQLSSVAEIRMDLVMNRVYNEGLSPVPSIHIPACVYVLFASRWRIVEPLNRRPRPAGWRRKAP